MQPTESEKAADGAWHDRMYDNRARVPDHPAHLRRWSDESQRARANLAGELDIPYGPGSRQRLDVFPARAGQEPAPVLVFIHGGYWRALDKTDHSFVARPFVERGACVVVPNYTLSPAATVDRITDEMSQALAWVHAEMPRFGGDVSRVTVAGHSAGGQLATMMLARHARVGLLRSALAISALHDLGPIRRTPHLQATLALTPAQVAAASPALQPPPPGGTLFTVVGEMESAEYHRQNRLIRDAWGPARVPVCEMLPGLDHFSILGALVDPAHRLHGFAAQLLGLPGAAAETRAPR